MHIESLHVKNYKGFKDFCIKFHPNQNLLIASNGQGKTSLLNAITYPLSRVAALFRGPLRTLETEEVRYEGSEKNNTWTFVPHFPSTISAVLNNSGKSCEVSFEQNSHRSQVYKIDGEYNRNLLVSDLFEGEATSENFVYPIFCFFDSSRRYQHTNFSVDAAINRERNSQSYGRWWTNQNIFHAFRDWFFLEDYRAYQFKKESPAIKFLNQALSETSFVQKLFFDSQRNEIIIVKKESEGGSAYATSDLSDGEQSWLAIVGEIFRVGWQHNSHLGSEMASNLTGVILIDELELHLHPKWQRELISTLKSLFPKIQFVFTTHSPQIISEFIEGSIFSIDSSLSEARLIPTEFPKDSNGILDSVMGGQSLPSEIKDFIEQVESLIYEGDLSEARERIKLTELKDPAITALSTLIEVRERLVDQLPEDLD